MFNLQCISFYRFYFYYRLNMIHVILFSKYFFLKKFMCKNLKHVIQKSLYHLFSERFLLLQSLVSNSIHAKLRSSQKWNVARIQFSVRLTDGGLHVVIQIPWIERRCIMSHHQKTVQDQPSLIRVGHEIYRVWDNY